MTADAPVTSENAEIPAKKIRVAASGRPTREIDAPPAPATSLCSTPRCTEPAGESGRCPRHERIARRGLRGSRRATRNRARERLRPSTAPDRCRQPGCRRRRDEPGPLCAAQGRVCATEAARKITRRCYVDGCELPPWGDRLYCPGHWAAVDRCQLDGCGFPVYPDGPLCAVHLRAAHALAISAA